MLLPHPGCFWQGIGALFAWGYYAERVDRQELFQLRQENNLQRQQLQRLVVDYENINYELNAPGHIGKPGFVSWPVSDVEPT